RTAGTQFTTGKIHNTTFITQRSLQSQSSTGTYFYIIRMRAKSKNIQFHQSKILRPQKSIKKPRKQTPGSLNKYLDRQIQFLHFVHTINCNGSSCTSASHVR